MVHSRSMSDVSNTAIVAYRITQRGVVNGKGSSPGYALADVCVLCEVCIIISTCFHDPHISRRDYLLALGVDNAHLPAKVNLAFLMQVEGRFKHSHIYIQVIYVVTQQ